MPRAAASNSWRSIAAAAWRTSRPAWRRLFQRGNRGNGLGAVVRQSHFVDIASWPGLGTAVLARIKPGTPDAKRSAPQDPAGARYRSPCRVKTCAAIPGRSPVTARTLFVADGLGHGPEAAEASVEAVRLFHRFNGHHVPTLLDYIHGGLRSTRGAAVSIARFDPAAHRLTFAGVGNVAGVLAINGELKRMVSMPGTAGHNARKIQSFDYPFESGLVILHSDGLSTSWTLARYPDLQAFHPTLIAAVLYRDFGRRRDDATVLVGKWAAPAADAANTDSA